MLYVNNLINDGRLYVLQIILMYLHTQITQNIKCCVDLQLVLHSTIQTATLMLK